jgi:phosphomannomutase
VSIAPSTSAGRHKSISGIFREYDIRGIVDETLFAEDAYHIGRAFAGKAGKGKIVICRDGRLSSPMLAKSLTRGIQDSGCDVVDIGVGPTPMLYYAAHTLKAAGGVMLTGSHNPPTHNGFKFVLHGKPFFGKDIQMLHAAIAVGAFAEGKGSAETLDIHERYIEVLLKAYDGARDLNIAWDAGNGATGDIMKALCQRLPGQHIALNAMIDGHFPAHHPDPSVPENLMQVSDTVRKRKLDFGIAFDGDGDRIGVVDNNGEMIYGDQLLMLYAADVLAANPGATVIADVKTSQSLFDHVAKLGGKPLMWKTGHSLIKSKMAETGAKLAGEMSGHMFFADKYFGYDDALYAAVRLLALVSRSGKKLSELCAALPKAVNTPELRFDCADDRKFEVIDEVKSRLKAEGANFSDIDGVRVNTPGGWWLLRASNTQAVLVGRCEAANEAALDVLKADLRRQLAASGVSLPF